MDYLSSKHLIKPFDVFFALRKTDFGEKKHYYVCVYTQSEDGNNKLRDDVYGLIVSTNPKYKNMLENDYNVEIEINGVECFVNCDKMVRIRLDENVELKTTRLPSSKKEEIKKMLNKFLKEMERQVNY